MERIDVEGLRCDSPAALPKHPRRQRRRKKGRFLKGPISLLWLAKASRQPGKALHVGVMLWHQAGMSGKREVKLRGKLLDQFGVHRRTAIRALDALEADDLIETLVKGRGRRRVVRLLDVENTQHEVRQDA